MRGTASVPLGPSVTMRGTASVPLGPSITMRGPPRYRSGPPLQYAVPPRYRSGPLLQCAVPPRYTARALHYTMRGTASVPLAGPLLQCAVPPRYRFGTARALYYNARYRHPVWVLQSFNWIGVRNFQENTKTNGKPRNATLDRSEELPRKHKDQRKATKRNLNIVVPALLQTGRSTLAPRHSKCTSCSTILFGWSVACRLLV